MDQFIPPVKDMIFALREVVGKGDLNSNSGFEDFDRDFLETVYESASEITSEIIAPTNKDGDRLGVSIDDGKVTVPNGYAEAYDAYVDGGWSTLSCNPQYGGQGMPASISMPVNEMVMGANFSWAHLVLLTNSAIRAVDAHANDELKDLYLEKLISGKFSGTMNLTEPQAGSDLSVMNTVAEPNGDSYKITGQKIFITWGEHDLSENIIHLVFKKSLIYVHVFLCSVFAHASMDKKIQNSMILLKQAKLTENCQKKNSNFSTFSILIARCLQGTSRQQKPRSTYIDILTFFGR